jgi:hypothetical protein
MVRLYHLCIFSPVHKYDVAEPGYSTAENDDNQEFLIHQILEKKKPTRLGAASGFGGVGGSLQGVFFRCSFAGKEWDILVGVIESVHPVDDVDGVLFELVARRRERRVIDLSTLHRSVDAASIRRRSIDLSFNRSAGARSID